MYEHINKSIMDKLYLASLIAMTTLLSFSTSGKEVTLWSLGEKDNSGAEFALAPDKFRDFIEHDFGYEDKYFIIDRKSVV